ncbi:hypothetical protein EW146_g9812 [Bondarzewia mesenterica]|uniref:Integrase catalytic domain-containing protein n=1 Tax=Bondarzewia mesenterica TaxID=1095465 RepID=A0A4S4L393_9AGAM|nr:hypothetical protein EW146_g9812 [Bondarzewia mesenterica]
MTTRPRRNTHLSIAPTHSSSESDSDDIDLMSILNPKARSPLSSKAESKLRTQLQTAQSHFGDFPPLTDDNYDTWAKDCLTRIELLTYGVLITTDRTDFGILTPWHAYIWDQTDLMVKNLILSRLTHPVRRRMEHLHKDFTTARSLWLAIRDEFINKGIVAQVNAIHHALSHTFPINSSLITIWDDIVADIDRIFENALDENRTEQSSKYSRGRSQFIDSTVAATTSSGAPGNNNSSKPHGPPPTCAHCGGRHISANCWAIFGKPPEAVFYDCKHCGGQSSGTAAATTLIPDNTVRPPAAQAVPAPLDGAFIESAAIALTEEEFEYFSCAAIPSSFMPTEHCSVDWTIYGPQSDVAAPLVLDAPYYFDSGSSCHISPSRDDLTDFITIFPCAIRGVNGSAVYAMGQGSLRLRLGKGRIFILPDVLFIPGTSIRLISVGHLCNMGDKYSVQFNDQQCFVRYKTSGQKLVTTVQQGRHAARPLGLVFADIIGPEAVEARGGCRFSLNLICDYSRMSFCYSLCQKSNSLPIFCHWHAMVEKQLGTEVGIFRTDNGGEFTAHEFENYLADDGILHQLSMPYTSAYMGEIERAHRTLMDHMRAILSDLHLLPSMWAKCLATMCYLKNWTPTRALSLKTP